MTYDELKQAVQDYLETSETTFVANIPRFVKAVENRIYNEVQMPALRKNSFGSLAQGSRYLTVPTDFLSVFSVALVDPDDESYHYLLYKDVNLIREIYPSPTATGVPKVYGLFNKETLIIGPSPDKEYGVELHYFYYPDSLVDAGSSWVATNFESVMLYGALAEGYRFLKGDPPQQQIYDDQYERALMLLRKLGEGRQRDDAYSTVGPKPNTTVGE